MPEPSGTGTTNEETSAGSEVEGGAASGTQADEARAAQDRKLSQEAAKYRVEAREAKKQLETLKAEFDELKSKTAPASPGGDQSASEVASLKRQMSELQKSLNEQRDLASKAVELSKQEKLDNAILKAVADAKVLDSDEAAVLLKAKGRAKIADDGKPVFVIDDNGEEREIVITASAIKANKLLSDKFYPSEGAAGTGSRGGSRAPAGGGVDINRAATDFKYFEAHRAEVLAAMKDRS